MAETPKPPHGLAFAPIKVGVLIDIDMGTKEDFLAVLRLGFDEALADRVLPRPVELVVKEAIGLPRLEAKNTIDGYRELADAGVLCVIGPLITDNSIALAPVIDATGVPAVTWTGTDRYHGEFCFNLGNGGLAEEGAIMASWIRRSGYRTVGMIHEISPGGVEYASAFRWYAARAGLDVLIEAYTTQVPDDLQAVLRKVQGQQPDCLAYLGYGYPTILMAPMWKSLGWDPPRIMTSAFQFCYAKPEWMAALEGWVGVDQMCEANPRLGPMLDRVEARLGRRRDHTVVPLSYDTTRLIAEGLARANLLTPRGVKEGLEKVRMLPATNGGPRTHMSLGPYDHKAYKGDWLVLRKIAGGRTVFVGLHEPAV
jgi:ABC-type branched-subunit amino acid transport system substrate-binding protein